MSKPPLTPSALPAVISVLPHREPFLMVDRVTELREGHVTGVRMFRAEEPFFLGHFPGRPIVPGVLLVEGLAQTMAYYALVHRTAQRAYLLGMDRVRFRKPVGPGVEVTFDVEMGEQRFGVLAGQGVVRVGTQRVAEATLKGFVGDPATALG